jgi:hypothetical protein
MAFDLKTTIPLKNDDLDVMSNDILHNNSHLKYSTTSNLRKRRDSQIIQFWSFIVELCFPPIILCKQKQLTCL